MRGGRRRVGVALIFLGAVEWSGPPRVIASSLSRARHCDANLVGRTRAEEKEKEAPFFSPPSLKLPASQLKLTCERGQQSFQ